MNAPRSDTTWLDYDHGIWLEHHLDSQIDRLVMELCRQVVAKSTLPMQESIDAWADRIAAQVAKLND